MGNGTRDADLAAECAALLIRCQVPFRVDYESGVWQFQVYDDAAGAGVDVINRMGDD